MTNLIDLMVAVNTGKTIQEDTEDQSEQLSLSSGSCGFCGVGGSQWRIDPYDEDINGFVRYDYICDDCHEIRLDDI